MGDKIYFRLLLLAPLSVLTLFLTLFLIKFGTSLTTDFNDIESWGQIGDYFGGVLNPLLAYFSFLGVLYTVWLNKKFLALSNEELRLSRDEMSRSTVALQEQNEQIRYQRLESTFFSLLSHLGNIAEDIVVDAEKLRQRGIEIETPFPAQSGKLGLQAILHVYYDQRRRHPSLSTEAASQAIFGQLADLIDFYCDTVNVILEFLASQKLEDNAFYKNLLIAQMSTDELLLLFYYALRSECEPLRKNIIQSGILGSLSASDLASPTEDAPWLNQMTLHP